MSDTIVLLAGTLNEAKYWEKYNHTGEERIIYAETLWHIQHLKGYRVQVWGTFWQREDATDIFDVALAGRIHD